MNSLTLSLQELVVPLLAGLLLGLIGLPGILLLDLATFALAVATLLPLSLPGVTKPRYGATTLISNPVPTFWQEIREGWAFIRQQPQLKLLLLLVVTANISITSVLLLTPPIILDVANEQTLGLVLSIGGLGTVAASLSLMVWGGWQQRVRAILLTALLCQLGIFLVGWPGGTTAVTVTLGLFLASVSAVFFMGHSTPLWQTAVPPHLMGRVLSLRTFFAQLTVPFVYIGLGSLVDTIEQTGIVPLPASHLVLLVVSVMGMTAVCILARPLLNAPSTPTPVQRTAVG